MTTMSEPTKGKSPAEETFLQRLVIWIISIATVALLFSMFSYVLYQYFSNSRPSEWAH